MQKIIPNIKIKTNMQKINLHENSSYNIKHAKLKQTKINHAKIKHKEIKHAKNKSTVIKPFKFKRKGPAKKDKRESEQPSSCSQMAAKQKQKLSFRQLGSDQIVGPLGDFVPLFKPTSGRSSGLAKVGKVRGTHLWA